MRTLLVANRGEIARRIFRTCRRLGIRAVAVYTDADRQALHAREADEAVQIPDYLDGEALLEAARRTAAEAIHPGYGFLAESPAFARACAAEGITFVGPSPEAVEVMGDKRRARLLAARVGLPTVPGAHGDDLESAAMRLGFPLLVKASAGGGGRGMWVVRHPSELAEALAACRREAFSAFGSGELLLERLVEPARHVEVQVLGDGRGRVVHLGERDCSVQRRWQKVVEEAPAPGVTPELREAMGKAAVELARAVHYTGAGTVEFLLDGEGRYSFLEMNTRIQVEHPVTEEVTGLDLVEWQIRVAGGELLPFTQEEVRLEGHAMEARVYAEPGRVLCWEPDREVRVESGIGPGDPVLPRYDPLVAKLVARGGDRFEALRRLVRACRSTVLLGVENNLPLLCQVLEHPEFRRGGVDTGFLERLPPPDRAADGWPLLAAAVDGWLDAGGDGWSNNPRPGEVVRFREGGEVRLRPLGPGLLQCQLEGEDRRVAVLGRGAHRLDLEVDGLRRSLPVARSGETWWIHTGRGGVRLHRMPRLPEPQPPPDAGGSLRAPLPGSISQVLVEVGQHVEKGAPVVRMEAMKMEHTLHTAASGVVEAVHYRPGDTVEADALLVTVRPL